MNEHYGLGVGSRILKLHHSQVNGHLRITIACLSYILGTVPAAPLGGRPAPQLAELDRSAISQKYAFLKYASCSWQWHIQMVTKEPAPRVEYVLRLLQLVTQFISSRDTVLMWLESTYLYRDPPSWEPLAKLLVWSRTASLLIDPNGMHNQSSSTDAMALFVTDVQTLQSNHNDTLFNEPQLVWSGVTDLLPKGGLLNDQPENFTECVPTEPLGHDRSERGDATEDNKSPMIVYSEVSSDGSLLGVCSVWAPRKFSELIVKVKHGAFKYSRSCSNDVDFDKVSTGWVARFEKWFIKDRDRPEEKNLKSWSTDIILEAKEVCRQLKNTLEIKKLCSFGFPIKFSPNLTKVAILNMIFDIGLMDNHQTLTHGKTYIPKTIQFPMADEYPIEDYRITFSSNEKYLGFHTVLKTSMLQVLGIYDLESPKNGHIWRMNVPSGVYCNISKWTDHEDVGSSLELTFHPTEPLVAWSGPVMGTFLSNFITEPCSE